MLDAVRSSWGLESRPSRRTRRDKASSKGILWLLSTVFPLGLLVASPLVRWNPPDVINSSCWAANLLASLSDSQDVAKSSMYMLCSTSAAARGAETRCRHTCTLTVLLARKREQVSHSFG
ncbi:hypothetical protein T12_8324 [Trichinella patagoniensis]|uniref:Uncharacterized protein n=1 Tax=Trichinella patagoniensis TaxID=990121 RepID=A0A0V0ZCH3_9BILA|nr:hypothetical protein T12_8324 [Trichinella patagoniensis]